MVQGIRKGIFQRLFSKSIIEHWNERKNPHNLDFLFVVGEFHRSSTRERCCYLPTSTSCVYIHTSLWTEPSESRHTWTRSVSWTQSSTWFEFFSTKKHSSTIEVSMDFSWWWSTMFESFSLRNIFKELRSDIPDFRIPKHGTLSGWARQGVLLLNACLTVEEHKANSHRGKGWEIFTVWDENNGHFHLTSWMRFIGRHYSIYQWSFFTSCLSTLGQRCSK